MEDIRVRVAYLQGLAEGLDLDTESPEGRILSTVIDVLGDLADQVMSVVDAQEDLADYVDEVDYDLGALEEVVLGEDDDDLSEYQMKSADFLDADEDDDEMVEVLSCPSCGEALAASAGEMNEEIRILCPSCGCLVCSEDVEFDDDEMVVDH